MVRRTPAIKRSATLAQGIKAIIARAVVGLQTPAEKDLTKNRSAKSGIGVKRPAITRRAPGRRRPEGRQGWRPATRDRQAHYPEGGPVCGVSVLSSRTG